MSIRSFLLTLFGVVSFSFASAQVIIQGKILDSLTHESIVYANIALDAGLGGVVSDIDGNFFLNIPKDYVGPITISHVSYTNRKLSLSYFKTHPTIYMFAGSTQLSELSITATKLENPAFEIIRRAVAHKPENDPANLKSYQYISYNKVFISTSEPTKRIDSIVHALRSRLDSTKLKRKEKRLLSFDSLLSTTYFFLSESVTEKQVINPNREKAKLLALKISGFKSPLFANTSSGNQPFSFYNDNITLMSKDFINPISRGTLSRYNFSIIDTSYYEKDTVYVIKFKPKSGRLFNGMQGVISICVKGYAIKKVTACTADTTMLSSACIEQNYERVQGHWFPVQLNTDVSFHNLIVGGRYLIDQHSNSIQDIKINPELDPTTFGDITTNFTMPKPEQSKIMLDSFRNVPLTKKEIRTYVLLDSIMQKLLWVDKAIEAVYTKTLPLGFLELGLDKIFKSNRHELFRFGIGLYTSPKFLKWARLGGYVGYGIRDEQWKYGGDIKFNFNLNRDFYLHLLYANDIYETGSLQDNRNIRLIDNESFRIRVASRYDRTQQYKAELGYRLFPGVHASVYLSKNDIQPAYHYRLLLDNQSLNHFSIAETGFALRYAQHEKYVTLAGKKVYRGQQFPVFTVAVGKAINAFGAQNFSYTHFDFTAAHMIKYRNGFKTNLFLTAGYINGIAPYGRMYNGRGSSPVRLYIKNYFQTMGLYEFTASQYASLFIMHNFGNILLNKKYTKPELLLYHNIGIGVLDHKQAHVNLALKDFSKGFVESGVGLDNIFRVSYFNVLYLGLGGGVFYRYGDYRFAQQTKNITWRLTFDIGF